MQKDASWVRSVLGNLGKARNAKQVAGVLVTTTFSLLLVVAACAPHRGHASRPPLDSEILGTWVAMDGVHRDRARIEFNEEGVVTLQDVPFAYLIGGNRVFVETYHYQTNPLTEEEITIPDDSDLVSTSGAWCIARSLLRPNRAAPTTYRAIYLALEPGAGLPDGGRLYIYYTREGKRPALFWEFEGDPNSRRRLYFRRRETTRTSSTDETPAEAPSREEWLEHELEAACTIDWQHLKPPIRDR